MSRVRARVFTYTGALDADIPWKPLGGRTDYAWSPDGKQLVLSARLRGSVEPTSTNFDIYRVPADGPTAPVNNPPDKPAWDSRPAYTPRRPPPPGCTGVSRPARRPCWGPPPPCVPRFPRRPAC